MPPPSLAPVTDPRLRLLLRGLDDLRLSLRCGICLEQIRGPVRTKCGHVFCRLCLHRAVEAAMEARAKQEAGPTGCGAKCPQCNSPNLTKRSLTDDKDTEEVLKAMNKLKAAIKKESVGAFDPGGYDSEASNPSSPVKIVTGNSAGATNTVDLFSGESMVPVLTPIAPSTLARAAAVKSTKSSKSSLISPVVPNNQEALKNSMTKKDKSANKAKGKGKRSSKGSKDSKSSDRSRKASQGGVSSSGKVVFQLKGKVVSALVDVDLRRDRVKARSNCVFVQLGRLAVKRTLSETFPDFSDIIARKRRASECNDDEERHPVSKRGRMDEAGDGGNKFEDVRSLNRAHLLQALASTAASSQPSKMSSTSQTGGVCKKGKRVSKDKVVKTALRQSTASSTATSQGDGSKRRRRSSGNKLNSVPKAPPVGSDEASIHTSSVEMLDEDKKQPTPPKTGKEFMERIVGEGKNNLYTQEQETEEEASRRVERLRELGEESDDKELTLEEGRLQSRRRKINKSSRKKRQLTESSMGSVSLRGQSPLNVHSLSSDVESPVKSLPQVDVPASVSGIPQRTTPKYSVSQAPSTSEFGDKKIPVLDDEEEENVILPVSQTSSVDVVAATATLAAYPTPSSASSRRMLKKAALASIENIRKQPLSTEETVIAGKKSSRVIRDDEEGEDDQQELPDLIPDSVNIVPDLASQKKLSRVKGSEDSTSIRMQRSGSNTTVTTESDADDMSTEEMRSRIRELESMVGNKKVPVKGGGDPASNKKTDDDGKHGDDGNSSDEDIFGSTPQRKERKRIRMLPQDSPAVTTNSSKVRKKLEVDANSENEANEADESVVAVESQSKQPSSHSETSKSTSLDPSLVRSFVLMPTGLNVEDKDLLQKFVQIVGCQIKTGLDDSVTHVIVKHDEGLKAERTLKYLQALIRGKMVIGMRWIQDSLEKKALLSPDDYEVVDLEGEPGPERARQAKSLKSPGLFHNFEFFLSGKFGAISHEQMRLLLIGAGGKVLRGEGLLSSNPGVARLIVVDRAHDPTRDPTECAKLFAFYDTAVVDRDWVIESVAAYRARGVMPFLAHEATRHELEHNAHIPEVMLPEEPSMAIT